MSRKIRMSNFENSHISKNMAETDSSDHEKKRTRTQFTKDERFHLLKIMEEYGSLLDDKNLSILARKEIWLRIEKKFNNGAFLGRTSAQLKKYWQNYKYHSKKMKLLQKLVTPETEKVIKTMEKTDPEDWNQYNNEFGLGISRSEKLLPSCQNQLEVEFAPNFGDLPKFNADSALLKLDLNAPISPDFLQKPLDLSTKKIVQELDTSFGNSSGNSDGDLVTISHSEHMLEKKAENRGTTDNRNSKFYTADASQQNPEKFDVVVSDTEVTGNKVTVSVIRPQKTPGSSKKISDSTKNSPTQIESNLENQNIIKIEPGSETENSEVMKMCENLKRPASRDSTESAENKAAKSPRVNTSVISGSKNKNKSDAIKKISGRPCLILKQKNNVGEKVVDKDLKANPFSGIGSSSVSSERIDKDSETQRTRIDGLSEFSNNSESLFGNGLNDFIDEEREENQIRMEDVEGSSGFGASEDPSSNLFIKFEWDHRLVLRQLETKEMLLKLKIAEMAIQETRLRIRAMDEERNRAKELHELRLARMTEENSQCISFEDLP